jgi:hypothetical protein
MKNYIGLALLLIGSAGIVCAGFPPPPVPEISVTTGMGALTLLAGGLLVIRGRGNKK